MFFDYHHCKILFCGLFFAKIYDFSPLFYIKPGHIYMYIYIDIILKSNYFNSLDIYAVVMYFIVHFNA